MTSRLRIELAVVIGKRCPNVAKAEALKYCFGYTCANDVSARDWQMNGGGGQWCREKRSRRSVRWTTLPRDC